MTEEMSRKAAFNKKEAAQLYAWITDKLKNHPRIPKVEPPPIRLKIYEHLDSAGNNLFSTSDHVDEDLFRHNVFYYFKSKLGIVRKQYRRTQVLKGPNGASGYVKECTCNEDELGAMPMTVGIEKG